MYNTLIDLSRLLQALQIFQVIEIVEKNCTAVVTTLYNMDRNSGNIEAGFPWHFETPYFSG
jgi:hypothetical protein